MKLLCLFCVFFKMCVFLLSSVFGFGSGSKFRPRIRVFRLPGRSGSRDMKCYFLLFEICFLSKWLFPSS